jgi:hypothetical protein
MINFWPQQRKCFQQMTKLSSHFIYKKSEARHKSNSIFVQALTTVSSVRWLEVAEIFGCKKTRKTYLEKKKKYSFKLNLQNKIKKEIINNHVTYYLTVKNIDTAHLRQSSIKYHILWFIYDAVNTSDYTASMATSFSKWYFGLDLEENYSALKCNKPLWYKYTNVRRVSSVTTIFDTFVSYMFRLTYKR